MCKFKDVALLGQGAGLAFWGVSSSLLDRTLGSVRTLDHRRLVECKVLKMFKKGHPWCVSRRGMINTTSATHSATSSHTESDFAAQGQNLARNVNYCID